jgi:hypothetical protein
MARGASRDACDSHAPSGELLLAVLVSRLGGRQVITADELAEARRLRLDVQSAGDALLLSAELAVHAPPIAQRPAFHLEAEA